MSEIENRGVAFWKILALMIASLIIFSVITNIYYANKIKSLTTEHISKIVEDEAKYLIEDIIKRKIEKIEFETSFYKHRLEDYLEQNNSVVTNDILNDLIFGGKYETDLLLFEDHRSGDLFHSFTYSIPIEELKKTSLIDFQKAQIVNLKESGISLIVQSIEIRDPIDTNRIKGHMHSIYIINNHSLLDVHKDVFKNDRIFLLLNRNIVESNVNNEQKYHQFFKTLEMKSSHETDFFQILEPLLIDNIDSGLMIYIKSANEFSSVLSQYIKDQFTWMLIQWVLIASSFGFAFHRMNNISLTSLLNLSTLLSKTNETVKFKPTLINEYNIIADALIDMSNNMKDKTLLLESISDAVQDAIILMDGNGTVKFCNTSIKNILGYSREEMLGKDMHQLIAPARYHATIYPNLKDFSKTGDGDIVGVLREVEALKKDGTTVFVELAVSSLKLNNEWYAVGSIRDISKRKKAEEILNESMDLLEKAQQLGKIGNWSWDFATGKVTCSDEIFRIYGHKPQSFDVTFENAFKSILREDRKKVGIAVKKVIDGDGKLTLYHGIILPDGSTRIVHELAEVIYDDQHNVIKMDGITQDVTDKQLLLKKLESSHKLLEQKVKERTKELQHEINERIEKETDLVLLQGFLEGYKKAIDSSAIFSITDISGEIIYVNGLFCEISEYRSEDVIGKTHNIIRSKNTSEEVYVDMWSTINNKQVWNGIIQNIKRSGVFYYADTTIIPILGKDGIIVEFIGVQHDVTKLYEALEKASIAEKAKSNFLASMSHEIRTPLNGIMGFIELLKQSNLDEIQKDYLNIIDTSSHNLRNMINDVLDFSKIESGKMELEILPFNPVNEFDTTVELFQAKANEKNIDLLYFSDPLQPEFLYGDHHKVKQILTNLISNAIKFTPENGLVSVSIRIATLNDNQCTLRFSIKDTGVGIATNKQQNIFNIFEQADASITRQYGGTGLGLALCKNLVSLMGSELLLESKVGSGSNFYFSLTFDLQENFSQTYYSIFSQNTIGVFITNEYLEQELLLQEYFTSMAINYKTFEDIDNISVKGLDSMIFFYSSNTELIISKFKEYFPDIPIIIILDGNQNIESIKQFTPYFINKPMNGSKIYNLLSQLFYSDSINDGDNDLINLSSKLTYPYDILIAEDNFVNQKLITIILKNLDAKVTLAENGKEAFEKATQVKFDLILMDIHMPEMDGIAATKAIIDYERSENYDKRTPIVALTADVIKEDLVLMKQAGIKDILKKPLVLNELIEVFGKYLDPVHINIEKFHVKNNFMLNYQDQIKVISEATCIDDIAIINELIFEFIESCENEVKLILDELGKKNIENVYMHSHSIKGMAANLHFQEILDISQSIEISSKNNEEIEYDVLIRQLSKAIKKLKLLWHSENPS